MLHAAHVLLILLYAALPAGLLIIALLTRQKKLIGHVLATLMVGLVLGCIICVGYGILLGSGIASVATMQYVKTAYLATSLMLLLHGLDAGVRWLFIRLSGKEWVALPARVLAITFIGLPLVGAAMLTYRVRVQSPVNPQTMFNIAYTPVTLEPTRGPELSAWFMANPSASTQTVLLLHDQASSKADLLPLAEPILKGGYNLMMLDFRAHGDSGGQLTGMGSTEDADVLEAVRWLKRERAGQSHRVMGIGIGTGGAALASAAQETPDINALVLVNTFESLPALADTSMRDYFKLRLFSWTIQQIVLPIANLHSGGAMSTFRPAGALASIWPRPVLIVHGVSDTVVPFRHGQRLYHAAMLPKDRIWISGGGHQNTLTRYGVMASILYFLQNAEDQPMI